MTIQRTSILAIVVFGALVAWPRATRAQTITSPYEFIAPAQAVGPFAGYIFTGKGAIGLGPESAAFFGARYGIRLSGPFTIEAGAGVLTSTRTVLDTVPGDTTLKAVGEADIRLLVLQGAIRFNVTGPRTWHRLQPFLVFGGGVAMDVAGASPADEPLPADVRFDFGTSFAGQLGAGVEWYPSPALSLRLDARNMLWKLETPTPFLRGDAALNLPDSEWAQNFTVSAGLALHF